MSNDDTKDSISPENLEYARKQLMQARTRLSQVKNQHYHGDKPTQEIKAEDLDNISLTMGRNVIISDCQLCVEISAKAIFKIVGINPVKSHEIELRDKQVEGVLNRLPLQADASKNVPRVIFLTQFWKRFYTLAKYGVPERNLSADDFMNTSDARRAIRDAEFCIKTARSLYEFQKDAQNIDS